MHGERPIAGDQHLSAVQDAQCSAKYVVVILLDALVRHVVVGVMWIVSTSVVQSRLHSYHALYRRQAPLLISFRDVYEI